MCFLLAKPESVRRELRRILKFWSPTVKVSELMVNEILPGPSALGPMSDNLTFVATFIGYWEQRQLLAKFEGDGDMRK